MNVRLCGFRLLLLRENYLARAHTLRSPPLVRKASTSRGALQAEQRCSLSDTQRSRTLIILKAAEACLPAMPSGYIVLKPDETSRERGMEGLEKEAARRLGFVRSSKAVHAAKSNSSPATPSRTPQGAFETSPCHSVHSRSTPAVGSEKRRHHLGPITGGVAVKRPCNAYLLPAAGQENLYTSGRLYSRPGGER